MQPKTKQFSGEDELKFLFTRFSNGTLETIIHDASDLVHRAVSRLARNSWGEGKLYAIIPDTTQLDKRKWRPMLWKDLAEELGTDKFMMSRAATWLKERDIVRTRELAGGGERIYLNPDPKPKPAPEPRPGPDPELPDYDWAKIHAPMLSAQFAAVDEKYKTVALPIITERLELTRLIKRTRENSCAMAATGAVANGRNQNAGHGATPYIRSLEPLEPIAAAAAVSPVAVIENALSEYAVVDAAAAPALLKSCRKHAPDCTPEEVAEVVRYKGRRMGKPENPLGLLLSQVPMLIRAALAKIRGSAPPADLDLTPDDIENMHLSGWTFGASR